MHSEGESNVKESLGIHLKMSANYATGVARRDLEHQAAELDLRF